MAHNNIYTVNGRLADLTSQVAELEAENKRLRVHLLNSLKQFVLDNRPKDGADGAPGKDGLSIKGDKGDVGPTGSVLYISDCEAAEQVKILRAALVEQRSKLLAAIAQAEYDARGDSSVHRIIRGRIAQLKKDAGL
jgi:hypothetical protein